MRKTGLVRLAVKMPLRYSLPPGVPFSSVFLIVFARPFQSSLLRTITSTAAGSCWSGRGCWGLAAADGFVPEARSINPYVRKQWEEDEKRGPTYYKRMEELQQVRAQASQMPAPEKQRLAKEIADVLAIEKSPTMRADLVRTLAVLPCPTAMVALDGAATDNDADVRAAACQALAGQQGPEAVKILAQLNGDADLDVRMEAARALGKHQGPEAAQALGLALDEHDPAIQRVAMESLKSSTGKDYGMSAKTWREFSTAAIPVPPTRQLGRTPATVLVLGCPADPWDGTPAPSLLRWGTSNRTGHESHPTAE